MSRSIAALRQTSDDDLIREHDEVAVNTVTGTQYYLDELNRRATERGTIAAQALARRVFWLSVVATVASLLAVAVSVVAIVLPRL